MKKELVFVGKMVLVGLVLVFLCGCPVTYWEASYREVAPVDIIGYGDLEITAFDIENYPYYYPPTFCGYHRTWDPYSRTYIWEENHRIRIHHHRHHHHRHHHHRHHH